MKTFICRELPQSQTSTSGWKLQKVGLLQCVDALSTDFHLPSSGTRLQKRECRSRDGLPRRHSREGHSLAGRKPQCRGQERVYAKPTTRLLAVAQLRAN